MLRHIQHLPQHTALPMVYGLGGQFPIEFELHRRQFTLFGNIVREKCIEKDLAFWQLAIKDDNSHSCISWFIMIKKNLYKYDFLALMSFLKTLQRKSSGRELLMRSWLNIGKNV